MVTNELRGERVDVVPYSDDPVELIQSALAPARVREVRLDDETGTATVIVSDYQLSLAIGKEGQNARLAARLTGWRIDIKSETQLAEEESGYAGEEWAEGEWIQNEAGEMVWQPAEGGSAVSATEWAEGADGADEAPGTDGKASSGAADGDVPSEPASAEAEATPTDERGRVEEAPTADPVDADGRRRRRPRRRPRGSGRGGSGIAPQRTCIGCRRTGPADTMVRVVRLGDGSLAPGRTLPGRGAWLCRDSTACVDQAAEAPGVRAGPPGPGRSPGRSTSCVGCSEGRPGSPGHDGSARPVL